MMKHLSLVAVASWGVFFSMAGIVMMYRFFVMFDRDDIRTALLRFSLAGCAWWTGIMGVLWYPWHMARVHGQYDLMRQLWVSDTALALMAVPAVACAIAVIYIAGDGPPITGKMWLGISLLALVAIFAAAEWVHWGV
jgi:hypothetical protein